MAAITILGSTGTIGCNTLDVVARNANRYEVYALTANANDQKMLEQCKSVHPKVVVMLQADAAERLQLNLQQHGLEDIEVLSGVEGLQFVAAADECDVVMAGIVGAAGFLPTLSAAKAGKRILLANKESLVMSGQLLMDAVHNHGAELLPVDSEHNAIWQCLPIADLKESGSARYNKSLAAAGVERILLTASGGPFRNTAASDLADVTPEQACAHPNWDMGRKISVDSATMMNKGLELIEACWLFDVRSGLIDVVIHPESIIHSMVSYKDGSVIAQMGNPDMRTPIASALAWPERIDSGVEPLNLFQVANLNFQRPDEQRFPNLRLARETVTSGGTASAILNAANEVAVESFLQERIRFTDISVVNERVLSAVSSHEADSLERILDDDQIARAKALEIVQSIM